MLEEAGWLLKNTHHFSTVVWWSCGSLQQNKWEIDLNSTAAASQWTLEPV